ncbi:MAG: ATP-dependent zinc metalloprotease FtsH, partial [Isosphaeraceae bacterium]|nr:ATP-dependent zinc metalloprotease FtsH [Isosphaeraceae bacterium]
VAETETRVNFDEVAGCDEAKTELREVVDFLRRPEHYRALGAKIPKGVLLVGPPGTGKTLLARAVAGEAGVPFFLISGSDFVEMFVGVGAARVRDLFRQAKAQAPCIIFLDELDAIGRQRGVHVGAVNDEREQTLNQLLVEMDGFEANSGVIVLSATNRPDVLDQALLRPGRFDRQVVIDAPDLDGREAILKIHARNKPLASDVDLRRIAQATPGFSGADLANAMNEAALLAARRQAHVIGQGDLDEAVEKVVAGPERRSRRLQEDVKRRVAYHEVGHALAAVHSKSSDPVQKISIIPRGHAALGYTLQRPENDRYLMTRSELIDRITGMMGGRAAEELVFGEATTGAENDLERATAMARQMVCLYGMSPTVGLVHCGQKPAPFLTEPFEGPFQRDCSEETARAIDEEVKKILAEGWENAKGLLAAHRDELDRIAAELLRRETLDSETFLELIGRPKNPPSPVPSPPSANGPPCATRP